MYKRILTVYCLMIVLLFGGCVNNNFPKGLKCNVPNLPDLDKFSSSHYESYKHHFPAAKTVIYKHNGTEIDITPDDPRVIRLLNFFAYSNEMGLSTWQQGYVEQEDIIGYLATNEPMLEIIFQNDGKPKVNTISNLHKLVICGDSYLQFVNVSTEACDIEDCLCVERWWPYGELIVSIIKDGGENENLISYDGWGSNYWIDFLVYAGFNSPGDGSVVPSQENEINPN